MRMLQESSNEGRDLPFLDVQVDDAISTVAMSGVVEIAIQSEQGRAIEVLQQDDQIRIRRSLPCQFKANLSNRHATLPERSLLGDWDVFVEDIHADFDSKL